MRCCHWLTLFLMLAMPGGAFADTTEEAPVRTVLAADGRSFTVGAPGFSEFHAGFAATIQRDGRALVIASANGERVGTAKLTTEATPYGRAEMKATTLRFEAERVELLFHLGQVPGGTGVLVQAGIRNIGKDPINVSFLTPLAGEFRALGNPADWLVTRLDNSVGKMPPVTPLGNIREPLNVHEYGGFYRQDGTGFLFGPVGAPLAYANARFLSGDEGKVKFDFTAEMSGVDVDPGETRWGQQVALLMEPPRPALAKWAEWVAKTHKAKTPKGAMMGWNSWNLLGQKVPSQDVLGVVDAVLKSEGRLVPSVIQLDDEFKQLAVRLADDAAPPSELSAYARQIVATGARPGLRLEFSREANGGKAPALADIAKVVRNAVRIGFTYLKIYYPTAAEQRGSKQTSFEAVRAAFDNIRQAAGADTYLMSCAREPDRAAVGLVDSSRMSTEASRTTIRSAMTDALRCFQLHDRWLTIDTDPYYIGTDISNISQITGGWPLVRTWMSMVGLSCGTAITSDPLHWESFRPYWRNTEVLTPPARERTEVLDLGTGSDWPRLVGHVRRDWGDSTVALLWNPGNAERTVKLDFAEAGMDPHRRYAVWSFWDNSYLGVAEGSWTTPRLGPAGSQHLRFTELDREPSKPVLIGSNLHIYCGAAEIGNVTSLQSGMEIELTDAGAREGDLFLYSRLPPVLKAATGCTVTGIVSAGEYAWRISLRDRRRGATQRIEVGIPLPVTRQPWFWLLIAAAVAGVLLAAWRYVVSLRLEREHALEGERTRIAMDLHDELGANLAQIGLLSELARRQLDRPEQARGQLNKLFAATHEISRQLDAAVWAINPANDTLDNLVQYLCKCSQEFLSLANIRCRLAVPVELPHVALTSAQRHNLVLTVKEALHNVVRHAEATLVTIRVLLPQGLLVVEIEDDGKGLPVEKLSPGQDGLGNMPKRLEQLCGRCEYFSGADGCGTLIRLTMPLPRP
ncbi:MAG: histidine kinase [Luteolibacter sp.]|uniref:histidine kinase n=1 Tax=Luteolibacter sp. TaxID=1962973 RepID=UPI00326650DC